VVRLRQEKGNPMTALPTPAEPEFLPGDEEEWFWDEPELDDVDFEMEEYIAYDPYEYGEW